MAYFTPRTFSFLRQLAVHNDRDWLADHRSEYERDVRQPVVRFVADAAAPLLGVSPYLDVDANRPAASVFHLRRDTRFADEPYKAYTGIHVRHFAVSGAQSPGFYLRIEPGNCFLSAGVWRPPGPRATSIRRALSGRPHEWVAATAPLSSWEKHGESRRRVPAGFDPAFEEDVCRRDFVYRLRFTHRQVGAPDFMDEFIAGCHAAAPFLAFVCAASGLDW